MSVHTAMGFLWTKILLFNTYSLTLSAVAWLGCSPNNHWEMSDHGHPRNWDMRLIILASPHFSTRETLSAIIHVSCQDKMCLGISFPYLWTHVFGLASISCSKCRLQISWFYHLIFNQIFYFLVWKLWRDGLFVGDSRTGRDWRSRFCQE